MAEHKRHEIELRAQRSRDLGARAGVERPRRELVGAQAGSDGELAGAGTDRLDDLARQPQASIERPAITVGPEIRRRREELRHEVSVRERQLDPIDIAVAGKAGRRPVAIDDLAQLARAERSRLTLEPRRGHRGGRHRRRSRWCPELLAAAVEQLHQQPRLVLVNGVGQAAVAAHDVWQIAPERVRREQAGGMDGSRLDHDRSHTAGRSRRVVGDQRVGRQMVVDKRRLMRGGEHPVTEPQRSK